jgi:hypothetical protein
MLRLAIAIPLCLSLVACQSGASPTSPTAPPTAGVTRIIAVEGDLDFGDIQVLTIAEKTIRIVNRGTGTMTVTGFTGPHGGGICQNPEDIEVCGAVSVSWTGGDIGPSQWQDVIVRFNTAHGDTVNGTVTVNGNATSGTPAIPISARSVLRM